MDNQDCHLLDKSINLVKECTLLANTTAFCQPLDVEVIEPLTANIQSMWLANKAETRTAAKKWKSTFELTIKAFEEIGKTTIKRPWDKSIFLIKEDNMEKDNTEKNNANKHSKLACRHIFNLNQKHFDNTIMKKIIFWLSILLN
jgi:DDE superfamily endonuclease